MSGSSRLVTASHAYGSSYRAWIKTGAKLLFWPTALLTMIGVALYLGAWKKEYVFSGPFAAETSPARHSLILKVPEQPHVAWWRQPLTGDYSAKPFESILELQINGQQIGPPHTQHETIREGKTSGFSHWGPNVIFSLPPGVKNAPETTATLRYCIGPRAWLTFALAFSSTLLGWFAYEAALKSFARRVRVLTLLGQHYAARPIAVAIRAPYLVLLALCCIGLIGSVAFMASSLYALATGWALPTTALIRWSSMATWAARNEPYLGYLLLSCAGFGTIMTWLAGSNPQHRQLIEADERALRKILLWCGFPIAACAFVFCISAMWAGLLRPGDLHYSNIGGLIPFSDAHGHLVAAHDQAKDGTWSSFALRRPLAAAFRSVLLFFSGYSLPIMLVLQACLLAAATCFAAHRIAMWRGVWTALAFFGLIHIYARIFVPTTLTEPLGLFWALWSVGFFVEALRSGSARPALAAFALTILALMTRMGSMFTVPALMVWLVWRFGKGAAAKLRIGVFAIGILLGILGLNSLLHKAYGTGPSSTTGNFAYTLCGLTMGTVWNGCLPELAADGKSLQEGEQVFVNYLYSMAWRNFRAHPDVFFQRLADGAGYFVTDFPNVIWKGYGQAIEEPDWLLRNILTAISLAGLFCIAARRTTALELTFWALVWASIVASSSIVYFDDGSRALAASHPLIALFFAMGMSTPALLPGKAPANSRLSHNAWVGMATAALLFACIPWVTHRLSPIKAISGGGLLQQRDEASVFVFGGRRMSGFLVVEDGQPLRHDVPALHLADFEAIIKQSGVETDQPLLHPVMPPLPFGFVFTPRLEKNVASAYQYIVPAEVVERPDVSAWRFKLVPWQGRYWFYVSKAEPWQP